MVPLIDTHSTISFNALVRSTRVQGTAQGAEQETRRCGPRLKNNSPNDLESGLTQMQCHHGPSQSQKAHPKSSACRKAIALNSPSVDMDVS